MAGALGRAGLTLTELTGVAYDPDNGRWKLAPGDLDVNYMAMAEKPGTD
jgi:2-polyprenyl-6-hydroxyphenyl methylase/3-demethylubiquinone-9 3-methyltransferase